MSLDIRNCDCMDLMAEFPDKYFDLAIVDPPFGIGENWKKDRQSKFYNHESTYKNFSGPNEAYFIELFRVSTNQIIWGANYYWNFLKPTNNLIFWDKMRDPFVTFNSAGELAWTSFSHVSFCKVTLPWNGCFTSEPRYGIHPHEKPIGLYNWQFNTYSKPGQKILDTHLGSGSIAIACHYFGCDLTACEIDKDYYNAAVKRIHEQTRQLTLI